MVLEILQEGIGKLPIGVLRNIIRMKRLPIEVKGIEDLRSILNTIYLDEQTRGLVTSILTLNEQHIETRGLACGVMLFSELAGIKNVS